MTCLAVPAWTSVAAAECTLAATGHSDTLVFRSVNGCPLLENAVLQRDVRTGDAYGLGSGKLLVATGGKTGYDFQIRDADTLRVIEHWQPIDDSGLTGQPQPSVLAVPAYPGWLKVDIRRRGHGAPLVSSPRFAVGEVIAIAGQSLAEKAISSSALDDDSPLRALGLSVGDAGAAFVAYASNTGVFPPVPDGPDVNFPPDRWLVPGDGNIVNSSFAVELMRRLRDRLHVPIGLVGYAVGGTGISTWLPGTKHFRKLSAVIRRAGGRIGVFLWIQGHYESKNGNTPPEYMKQLQSLFGDYQRAFAGPSGGRFNRVVITIPAIGKYDGSPAAINMVRRTAKTYARLAGNTLYVDGLDATLMPDMLHPSQAGNVVLADHVYRAVAYSLGLLPHGDEGPHVVSASHVVGSNVIRLRVTEINGAGGLVGVGDLDTQFEVYAAGSGSPSALLAGGVIIVGPREIDLHLKSVPSETENLTVWYRRSPDTPDAVKSGIYDTAVDHDGLTRGRQLWCGAEAIPVSNRRPASAGGPQRGSVR